MKIMWIKIKCLFRQRNIGVKIRLEEVLVSKDVEKYNKPGKRLTRPGRARFGWSKNLPTKLSKARGWSYVSQSLLISELTLRQSLFVKF